jgi:CBS domain-containing protein
MMTARDEEAVMKRWLYHYDSVRGVPDQLEQTLRHRVRDLLATVAGDDVEQTTEGDLLIRLPAHVLGLDLHKMVRLHTGVAERHDDGRTTIPLRWHAEPAKHLFPSFDGDIEFEAQSTSVAHLTIVGAATLPLGPVGGAADATVLGSIADRTVRYLTESLAAALEQTATGSQHDTEQESEPSETTADQMRVRDVMSADPLMLNEQMPIKTAALLLFHYDVAGAPVSNDAGGLVGVLSEADLVDVEAPPAWGLSRKADTSRRHKQARTVGEACSRPALEITPTASLRHAAQAMRDHDIARLVVVDGSEVIGVVSRHDVLKAIARGDAQIQAAVDRLLAEQGTAEVIADVDWGIIRVTGRVHTRSDASRLVGLISEVDGVTGVDGDLVWDVDDIIPPVVPML